ncbi:glycosyltransferase [Vibrio splendidus]|uniref:glycosyltransferase n=1 Tax=Vibrio splendidus TaxID=29497 RepID=UPI000CBA8DEA|nr:glycosyltransferase [Vibrio splendidus]PMI70694.1 hypothetical protein BCU37_07425 [Vibrio splendidus]PMK14034.1 hypothetical protein BCU10_16920 [Vibrio splendidus]PMK60448.1 hypothetical protein BCT96_11535 [Vibrio splendidus]
MKILQINKYYDPIIGGVETVCKQHSEYLAREHDVTVLCCSKSRAKKTEKVNINNVRVVRAKSWGTFFSMPISFSFLFRLLALFFKSDLVFIHYPFPLAKVGLLLAQFLFFFKKTKVIVVWHSDIVKQKRIYYFLRPFTKVLLRNANLILTTSPNMIKYSPMLKLFESKCSVLPLSVDISDVIDKSKSFMEPDSPIGGSYDIIFFGRLCYYKGIDVFIDALVEMSEKSIYPKVLIVGRGELSNMVYDKIIEYGLDNVHFHNEFISEVEKYIVLGNSRLFVFPSVAVSEAFGITQLEAMALKKPVINTSLNSGVPWVSLHNVSGRTVSPNNSQELAFELLHLLDNGELCIQLGEGGYSRVKENFDDDIVMNKLDNYINTLF